MLTQPKWIVDKYIFKHNKIPKEVFKNLDIEFFEYDYISFLLKDIEIPFNKFEPVVIYTTVSSAKKLREFFGCYYDDFSYNCNVFMSLLEVDSKMFLNHDHLYCTLGDLVKNYEYYFNLMGTDKLFFRPNKGGKEFTGNVWSSSEILGQIDIIQKRYGVESDTMILVSTPKKLLDESRFIVADREILASSRYKVEGIHQEDLKVPPESTQLVREIAETSGWLPNDIFVIDIATTEEGPKIIELNSFSCSGWYAMDPEEVIRKVSNFVIKDFDKNKLY